MLFAPFNNSVQPLLLAALVSVACLTGDPTGARAGLAQQRSNQVHAVGDEQCPSPGDLNSLVATSGALIEQARYREAAATLQAVSDRNCEPRASLLFAAAMEGSGDLSKAEDALQHAHMVWPANQSISVSLARDLLKDGKTEKAAQALDQFKATPATPEQELELSVVVYLSNHQLIDAYTAAQVNYSAYPSIRSLLLLANALQLEGRYKDVVALLESKRGSYSNSASFLITLAESEFDEKIFDAARADLMRSVSIDPNLYQGHYLLGNVLMNSSDVEGAIQEYRLAIKLNPNQPRTYFQLALALRAKQDEAGEEGALRQTLALNPHFAMAHSEMGRILVNDKRLQEAVVQLNLAIQDNPKSEQAYYLLARAYDRLGESDKSTEMAKRLASVRSANQHGGEDKEGRQGATDPLATH